MSLSTKWFYKCKSPDDKEQLKKTLSASRHILDLLEEIVSKELEAERAVPKSDYDNAAWAYKQADRNGATRAYLNVLNLIKKDNDPT